jgi:hypothetical protein
MITWMTKCGGSVKHARVHTCQSQLKRDDYDSLSMPTLRPTTTKLPETCETTQYRPPGLRCHPIRQGSFCCTPSSHGRTPRGAATASSPSTAWRRWSSRWCSTSRRPRSRSAGSTSSSWRRRSSSIGCGSRCWSSARRTSGWCRAPEAPQRYTSPLPVIYLRRTPGTLRYRCLRPVIREFE